MMLRILMFLVVLWMPLVHAQQYQQYAVIYFDGIGDTPASGDLQPCCDITKLEFSFDESFLYVTATFQQPLTADQHFGVSFGVNEDPQAGSVSEVLSENVLNGLDLIFTTADDPAKALVSYISTHDQRRTDTTLTVDVTRLQDQMVLHIPVEVLGSVSVRHATSASIRYIEVAPNIMSRVVWEFAPDMGLPPIEIFIPQEGVCIDTDGDGWGWRMNAGGGGQSCQVHSIVEEINEALYEGIQCLDTDGDGWGWQQPTNAPGRSCELPNVDQTPPESVYVGIECIDSDGDGWGWQEPDGYPGRSCLAM